MKMNRNYDQIKEEILKAYQDMENCIQGTTSDVCIDLYTDEIYRGKVLREFLKQLEKQFNNTEFDRLFPVLEETRKRYKFIKTSAISFSDGGMPSGNIYRVGFFNPDLQVALVLESSQDWEDVCNPETDQIEWWDYHHIRVYLYNSDIPFTNDDLYWLGRFEEFFFLTRNNRVTLA